MIPGRQQPKLLPVLVRIQEERKKFGLTMKDFATRAGIGRHTVNCAEAGKSVPTLIVTSWMAGAVLLELTAVPLSPTRRAAEYAEFLRAQGWRVEAPK